MRRYAKRHHLLACSLAALAGFVDALGFLRLGGLFVSFMSGNSTRLAVGSIGATSGMPFAAALIAAFVVGVIAGTLIGRVSGTRRTPALLASVALALALAAVTASGDGTAMAAPLLMAVAMGATNAVFQRDGEVSVGVTYMTGTLVKFAQHLATALVGGPRYAWVPYLLLWIGLVAGAVAGAALYDRLGLQALWIAAATALMFAVGTALAPLREAAEDAVVPPGQGG